MIWDSIAIMTIIDLAIISLAIFVTFTFHNYRQVLKELKLLSGIYLILSGLLLIALFYLTDLATMFVLPIFMPMKKAMMIMSDLHLNYNWIITVVAVLLIVIGLIYLIKYMIPKINMLVMDLKKSKEKLEEDISKRKTMEIELKRLNVELDRKFKELEQIVYVTSHDLRAPLVNINGYSKMTVNSVKEIVPILENADISEEVIEKIFSIVETDIQKAEHYISTNIYKMNALLSSLLRLSRLGIIEVKKEHIDMNKMMIDIKDSMAHPLNELGVKVEVSELPSCTGDEAQLNQVFSNLVGNAQKYLDLTRPGVITISGNAENGNLVYCVEDNGIGISTEHQDRIFELFHQLNPGMGGEGVGLNIVQKIIERHNGNIWVESEIDKGSKFFISLPMDKK